MDLNDLRNYKSHCMTMHTSDGKYYTIDIKNEKCPYVNVSMTVDSYDLENSSNEDIKEIARKFVMEYVVRYEKSIKRLYDRDYYKILNLVKGLLYHTFLPF